MKWCEFTLAVAMQCCEVDIKVDYRMLPKEATVGWHQPTVASLVLPGCSLVLLYQATGSTKRTTR